MLDMHDERRQPELTWQAQEVVREVDHRPHLLLRVTVRGGYFPHRAPVPFLRIAEVGEAAVRAWFTEISGDSSAMVGYFATDVPRGGVIEYGYDDEVLGRVPARFSAGPVKRLERERLPGNVVEVTRGFLEEKRRQQEEHRPG